MKRSTLKRDMIAANGGKILITKNGVEHALGLGHDTVSQMLAGTDYKVVGGTHKRLYCIDDVITAFLAYEG